MTRPHTISLISVSCLRDLPVACYAIEYAYKFIDFDQCYLIVPDNDCRAFARRLNPQIHVVAESDFFSHFNRNKVHDALSEQFKYRTNWYLQQLIKISASRALCEQGDVLIWDSDTVPLRKLNFQTHSGQIQFYRGKEFHAPYFQSINSLLNFEASNTVSFISQCFYLRKQWICAFVDYVEDTHRQPWPHAILSCLENKNYAEFSEYETLGAYIARFYPGEFQMTDRKWLRLGSSYLLGRENINDRRLARLGCEFDFVAFEHWDKPKFKHFLRFYRRGLADLISKRSPAQ